MTEPTPEQQQAVNRFTMLNLAVQTARDERDRSAYEANQIGVSYAVLADAIGATKSYGQQLVKRGRELKEA
jgi:hypothetical protein